MDNREIALAADMASGEGGGSGGTTDYNDLSNKPQIGGSQLIGNKTATDLGLQTAIDSAHKLDADLVDDSASGHKFAWSGTQAAYAQAAANIAEGELVAFTDDTDIDTTPTQGSDNPVTSGGVFSSLARLDASTGDIYFGQTRVGRKMSQADYDELTTKDSIYYVTYQPAQNSGRSLETPPATKNEISDGEDIRTEPLEEIKAEPGEEKELKEPEPELKKGGED